MEEDIGLDYSERAHLCAPKFGFPLKPITWINPLSIARRVPKLMREIPIDFGTTDKVFSSQWLSETEILVGTKCNKLYVIDTGDNRQLEIPRLSKPSALASSTSSCGIHSITVSPSGDYVATGGHDPNYLALYSLPHILPLALGEAHTDWIFDTQWLSNNLLISGSRDSSMALWTVHSAIENSRQSAGEQDGQIEDNPSGCLAECVPVIEPIFHFSNISTDACSLTSAGERVRGLAYNEQKYELASLQANQCAASLHFWDVFLFQQVSKVTLPYCAENVCVQVDSDGTMLYAVGSRSHVTFIDPRQPSACIAGSVKSLDKDCGVRSLAFNQQLLSIGTGAGHLYFYDMRTKDWLVDKVGSVPCVITTSEGWLRRDQTFQDFFSGLPRPPNAIYTHHYSPLRTKIFTAGGPLPLGLCGNYASVWM